MPKYIELSANVNVGSSAAVTGTVLGGKKVKPYLKNGELQGYVITSPLTGRNILIEKENTFSGDTEMPSFKDAVSCPEIQEEGYLEEHLAIMFGQIIYLKPLGNGQIEILEQMPMIDCTWKEEER